MIQMYGNNSFLLNIKNPWVNPLRVFYVRYLLEYVFSFFKKVAEDVFSVLLALLFFDAGELFQQVPLLGRQIGRSDDFDKDVLITACTTMHDGNSHALETERTTTLRSRRDLEQSRFRVNSGHLHFVAKGSLREADGQFVDDIVALALEERMGLDGKDDVEIAGGATPCADFAFACDTDVNAIIDACRNVDHHATIVAYATLTTAFLTRCRDHTAFTTTAFTHGDIDELAEDRLLHTANLTASLTGRAA